MAQVAQSDVDTPLIEEQVETGLGALLAAHHPNFVPGGEKKDDLLKRFTLYPNKPLPEFDHAFAKAYEASDDFNAQRQVYAMVCDSTLPYRHHAIHELTGFVNPCISAMLGAGTVNCSHLGESRFVIFIERPQGKRLSSLVTNQTRLHEHLVIDYVLQPAAKALLAMREKKVSHGNIHPGAFFISETPVLMECYSMPCGTMGHYLYEPLERLMADPLGHGEATEKADMYALGMLAFDLMYGLDKIKAVPKEDLIKRMMQMGSYHAFTNNRDFSDAFQDLFRGVLNDNPLERWGLDQLAQWIGGKRFNMIAPSAPKEAARPFLFATENFLNRRLLAHAFHRNWREAIKDIKGLKLDRWCEAGLHRPELAERIERVTRFVGDASTDKQMTDMMMRVISVLDPAGPLRTMTLSLRPDAIGLLLADSMRHDSADVPALLGMIEHDIATFWADQMDGNKTQDMSQAIWRLQKVKPYLKSKAFGFGLERTLYELNPSFPCQSPILKKYHVTTSLEALKTLDAIAMQMAPDTSFLDRHLAAFVAAKIDMGKEIRLTDLSNIPNLAQNEELVVLRILARAQNKHPKLHLVGLTTWTAMRLEKMIDEVHNRVIRKRLKLQLKKYASTGVLDDILSAILNRDVANRDYNGFIQAIALHEINQQRIERLENEAILEYKARKTGGKIATMISFTALTITAYISLTSAMGF